MRHLLRWIAAVAATFWWLGAVLLVAPWSRSAAYALFRRWARVLRRIFQVELTVEDPHGAVAGDGPRIFVNLNQTSLVESLVSPEAMPSGYLVFANFEYLLLPFLGWSVWALGAIMVVRQWPAQRRRALQRAMTFARSGGCIYMSIEGRRGDGRSLSPYKTGPARLAIASGATLVPVVFFGAADRLPRGSWRVQPGPVRIRLLEPIDPTGLGEKDVGSLVARLRALAERELDLGTD